MVRVRVRDRVRAAVTTMNVYAHTDEKRNQDAVEKLRAAITSG